MQRCPECNSLFSETKKFCEFDGASLVEADTYPNDASKHSNPPDAQRVSPETATLAAQRRRPGWQKTLALIVIADAALGLIVFLIFYGITRQQQPEGGPDQSSSPSVIQQAGPPGFSQPSPEASASPSIEPSPSPSLAPSPSPQTRTNEVSSSPISTGGDGKNRGVPVIIRLSDGASIEADEAWETSEGIWYRRGTVVSLLSANQVKAIERVVPPKPQSSASLPPSP